MTGRARVFTRERDVIAALKGTAGEPVVEGDVIVLAGRGPLGSGHGGDLPGDLRPPLPAGGPTASPSSPTHASRASRPAPCIGHVSPEALEGGPIGKLVDGDLSGSSSTRGASRRRSTSSATATRSGRADEAAAVLERASDEPGGRAGRRPAGRHRALGAPAVGERRPLGRLRLRRRVDLRRAGRGCGGHGHGG